MSTPIKQGKGKKYKWAFSSIPLFLLIFSGAKKFQPSKNFSLTIKYSFPPYVRLELLQGIRKEELHTIEYVLGGLELISHQEELFNTAEKLLNKLKGKGLNLGIVDLLLAAESLLTNAPIYSLDRIFEKLAQQNLIQLFKIH